MRSLSTSANNSLSPGTPQPTIAWTSRSDAVNPDVQKLSLVPQIPSAGQRDPVKATFGGRAMENPLVEIRIQSGGGSTLSMTSKVGSVLLPQDSASVDRIATAETMLLTRST